MKKMMKKFTVAMMAVLFTAAVPLTAHAGQWQQDQTGWWYQNDNGSYSTNQWQEISGRWYYFESSGYMKTGWLESAGKWYFLGSDGSMFSSGLSPEGYPLNRQGQWIVPTMTVDGLKAEFNAHMYDQNYLKELENFINSEEYSKTISLNSAIQEGDLEGSLKRYIAENNSIDYTRFYTSGNKAVRYFGTLYEIIRVNNIHTASEILVAYRQNDRTGIEQINKRYEERTSGILKDALEIVNYFSTY